MKRILTAVLFTALIFQGVAQNYTATEVPNDPLGVKMYTLKNGLKVYLSVNKDKPRVQTCIAVNTGSKNDPADATGLAHYLEHMIFKGNSQYATIDWEKEKVELKKISDLYEKHRDEKDPAKKKAIYHQIDSVSGVAAKYAVANEYDKMMSSLGAQGTNAFTSLEQTVYINDVPATELEKWMFLEASRFSELTLRLFHTELEAVYEEFNRGLDNDFSLAFQTLNELTYPTHPYGTQTTIGTGEHLKNPSMVKIHEYFDTYYVPNNVAICLAGDIDPAKTIALIDKYFGGWEKKEFTPKVMPKEKPLTAVVSKELMGPMPDFLMMAYRVGGYHTADAMKLDMMSSILSNGKAGLVDLNLMQSQKVLQAQTQASVNHDYSELMMMAMPKAGQSLEEARDLLIAQVELIKKGEFDEKLMQTIIRNAKVDELQGFKENWPRAMTMVNTFIMQADWKDNVVYYDEMAKLTKEDIVKFANDNFKDNYAIVYKKNGVNENIYKVDKPEITPIEINREAQSEFFKKFEAMKSSRLTPSFVDYEKEIKAGEVADGVKFHYIKNKQDKLWTLFLSVDEKAKYDNKISMALDYLPYLSTSKYSAVELQQEFYRLAIEFSARQGGSPYVYMSGLDESFDEALVLFEHIIHNVQPNEEALKQLVADEIKARADNKKSKGSILRNIATFAKYGPKNPSTHNLSTAELEALTAQELVDIIKNLLDIKHKMFYFGPREYDAVLASLKKEHKVNAVKDYVGEVKFPELEIKDKVVYFIDYDMVQTEIRMLSKGQAFDPTIMGQAKLFNQFFGSGLSSIVFQEIREAKALAYSSYVGFSVPGDKDKSHYVNAYLGTQTNKLAQAVDALLELMNNMPEAKLQFEQSKESALKQLEAERVIKSSIYWSYLTAEKRGLKKDIREEMYNTIKGMTLEDLKKFFDANIKGRTFAYCLIGKKSEIDWEAIKKLGEVKELTLEQVFGY